MKRQHERQVKHTELLAGIVASTIANTSLNSPEEPSKPADFMPSEHIKSETTPQKAPADAVSDVREFFRKMNVLRENKPE